MAAVIGVVIPARDEEGTVGGVVTAVRDALPGAHVVVVDDASRDRTAARAGAAGAQVITLPDRRGYAHALRVGYQSALDAGSEHIAQIDADGQHDPGDLVNVLSGLESYDVVLGSRFLGPGYAMPLGRRAGIAACRWMTRQVGGFALTDPTSGFRAVRHDVAEAVARHGFPDGLTESSFLIRLHRDGHRIGEVPVTMRPPGQKSMHDGFAGVVHFARISRAVLSLALLRTPH